MSSGLLPSSTLVDYDSKKLLKNLFLSASATIGASLAYKFSDAIQYGSLFMWNKISKPFWRSSTLSIEEYLDNGSSNEIYRAMSNYIFSKEESKYGSFAILPLVSDYHHAT